MTQARRVSVLFRLNKKAQFFKNSVSGHENQVLRFMASRRTSLKITQAIFISDHMVLTHCKNLLAKLEARNTAHLEMQGVRMGLL